LNSKPSISPFISSGSNSKNNEDEEEDNKCSITDRISGNTAQYVPAFQKTDQGTNRVADRAQIYEER